MKKGFINFDNKRYPIRCINIPKHGEVLISTFSLENRLIIDDFYVSDEAKDIDALIFYYVDDKIFNLSDAKLKRHISKELTGSLVM